MIVLALTEDRVLEALLPHGYAAFYGADWVQEYTGHDSLDEVIEVLERLVAAGTIRAFDTHGVGWMPDEQRYAIPARRTYFFGAYVPWVRARPEVYERWMAEVRAHRAEADRAFGRKPRTEDPPDWWPW